MLTRLNVVKVYLFASLVFMLITAAVAAPQSEPEPTPNQEAKVHEIKVAPYTLRANTLRSTFLPEEMARQYNIKPSPDLGILNVVILKQTQDEQPVTVPAKLSANQQNLLGQPELIELRKIEINDYISYLGTFNAKDQRIFRFTVQAQPDGEKTHLTLEFEDRFAADIPE